MKRIHHSYEQARDGSSKYVARDDLDREGIAYLRNVRGFSTYRVARLMGCSHATVSRIARTFPESALDVTRIRAEHSEEVLDLCAIEDTP